MNLHGKTGLPSPLSSPAGSFGFQSYGTTQGLTCPSVQALAQDREGYLWAGTEDGLFRYDGTRFSRFGAGEGLPDDHVIVLELATGGTLWAGTAGGLAWWDGSVFHPAEPKVGPPLGSISSLAFRRDGRILAAPLAGGIFQGSRKDPFVSLPGWPNTRRAEGLWVDPRKDEILTISGGTLYRMASSGVWTSSTLPIADKIKAIATYAIRRDPQGRLWIFGRHSAFVQMVEGGAFQDWSRRIPGLPQVPWAFTDAQGRIGAAGGTGVLLPEVPSPEQDSAWWILGAKQGLPTPWSRVAFVDREGSLWVGSAGLHRIQGRMAWARHMLQDGLPSVEMWGLLRSRDGTLWAATEGGLAEGNLRGWRTVPPTRGLAVLALAEDSQGTLWAGGSPRLGLLHRARGAWSRIRLDPRMVFTRITALDHVPRLGLLVGTLGNGLCRFDGRAIRSVDLPEGDPHERIGSILHDHQGRVWVAGSKGLALFEKGSWRRFSSAGHGFRDLNVYSLAEAPGGDIWVGYFGSFGLSRFRADADGGRVVEHLDVSSGLVSNNVSSVGYDASGKLWVATNHGVHRVDGKRVEHYGIGEGLPGEDCAAISLLADPDGRVWIGTTNGLAEFRGDFPGGPVAPPVSVISKARYGSGLPLPMMGEPITIPFRDRAVEFTCSALSFLNESKLQFQTRIEELGGLKGIDSAWSDSEPRQARFPALPPGTYRFEVRSRLGNGDFGPVASCSFRIPAPWWLTWWFRWLLPGVLGSLLATGLAWGAFRFRLARLASLNAALTERNRIAQDFHDGVGQGLTGIVLYLGAMKQSPGIEQRKESLEKALDLANSTLADVRRTMRALSPGSLDGGDLGGAVQQLVARIGPGASAAIALDDGPLPPLLPHVCHHLYRIAEEALTNALRHSGADRIEITLLEEGGWILLSIRDNGKGIPDQEEPDQGLPVHGSGVSGMRDRARALKGQFILESTPGGGTEIRIRVPVSFVARLRSSIGRYS